MQFRLSILWKTIGKLWEQGEKCFCFYIEEWRKLGRAIFNESSLEENESLELWWLFTGWLIIVSHCLGCCWARRKSFFFPAKGCKVSFFWWVYDVGFMNGTCVRPSTPRVSQIHFGKGFPLLIFMFYIL